MMLHAHHQLGWLNSIFEHICCTLWRYIGVVGAVISQILFIHCRHISAQTGELSTSYSHHRKMLASQLCFLMATILSNMLPMSTCTDFSKVVRVQSPFQHQNCSSQHSDCSPHKPTRCRKIHNAPAFCIPHALQRDKNMSFAIVVIDNPAILVVPLKQLNKLIRCLHCVLSPINYWTMFNQLYNCFLRSFQLSLPPQRLPVLLLQSLGY